MIDWQQFNAYLLQRNCPKAAGDRLRYAKQFHHILFQTGNAQELLQMPPQKRLHIMKSLVALSRFQGCHDNWLAIKQKYSLTWSQGDSLQAFNRFFDDELNYDTMLQRIRLMIEKTPPSVGKIIKFACLIGLRPSEVVESVRLLNTIAYTQRYYNPERQALEHFRFPDVFLRQTKKAYISFVTPSMIEDVTTQGRKIPTYNQIRLACWKRGITCDMRFCRKIFASHLRQEGIQPEIVDLLQGRTPQSVLARHYLVPQSTVKGQVLRALDRLKQAIDDDDGKI